LLSRQTQAARRNDARQGKAGTEDARIQAASAATGQAGQIMATLGLIEQTLYNWVKAEREG
jgi:hypothetical protein